MAAYKVFPYKGFGGGLNLRDGPEVVEEDQAIDALNVLFTTRGSVTQRSGYAKFTSVEGTNRYDSLAAFYKSDGTKQLIAGAGNRLEAITAAGAVTASTNAPTANPHYFQRFGGPTAEHIYIANGTDALRRWTGAAFETPTYTGVTPSGKFLGLSVDDNRLVNARFTGSTAGNNPSTVRFSMEGDPLTWTATHYEDLTPGDGEEIMGLATWRDLVVVFKQTKFFVFFGQSVDDDGEPEFNKRAVQAGVGLASPNALAVAEQGIYFLDRSGIYFTDGRQPSRVSDIVEPIFHGGSSVYYQGGELNDASITDVTMTYHDERLWLSFPASTSADNNRQLVFDPHEKWWSLTDFPAGPMTNFRPGFVEELVFGYSSGGKYIGRYVDGQYTADDMGEVYTNLVTNPKAGSGVTTNWTNTSLVSLVAGTLGAGGFPAHAAPVPVGLTTAIQAVSNADADRASHSFPVVSGTSYYVQVHFYLANLAATNVLVSINNSSGVEKISEAQTSLGAWQRVEMFFTADETATWTLRMTQTDAGSAEWFYTAVMVTASPDAIDYFDGDGNTWLGVEELSQSSKFVPAVGGTAITARWQSGWFNYGQPVVKTIREAKLSGIGLVTLAFHRDYRQSPTVSQSIELSPVDALYDSGATYDSGLLYGPSTIVQPKPFRKSIAGEVFSVVLSNSTLNRSFKVHRLVTHVREVRVPSVVKVN